MSELQEIIKTAMLGTEKYFPIIHTSLIQEVQAKIAKDQEDQEDAFLKLSAGFFLLHKAGMQMPENEYRHAAPPPETKESMRAEAASLWRQLLQTKEEALQEYFVCLCINKGKIARPELVPELLNLALENKRMKASLLQICGARASWLAGLNEDWRPLLAVPEEDVWETGSLPQRKEHLSSVRRQNPQAAVALLQKSISEENAATRNELLEILVINLSLEDEAFLESQLKDKSGKVKQTAYALLKMLPGSAISQQYQAFMKEALQLKEERVMLLAKKKVLAIHNSVSLPETLVQSGIDKISSQKGVEDVHYWIAQGMEYIHPDFWQQAYALSPEQLVQLIASHKQKSLWIPALVNCAFLFKHRELATALLQYADAPYPQLLQLLPLEERYHFAEGLLDGHAAATLPLLWDDAFTQMPVKLCRQFLQKFKQEPYSIQQPQYLRWAVYMPAALLEELRELAGPGREALEYQQRYLKNMATEMLRVIESREQINTSLSSK